MGVGTVHHIAWRAKDDEEPLEWQKFIADHDYRITDVRDRNYFNAIYFREHGELLFEIATDGPGFTIDGDVETLGETLDLPPFLEERRPEIEENLKPIEEN